VTAAEPTRTPLWTALAFVGLLLAGAAVVPTPPGVTESGQAVVAFYRDHHDAVALQAWLTMAASLPAAALVAFVMQRMSTPARYAFLLTAATTVGVLAVGVLLRLGLARHPATLDPGTARSIADVEAYWAPLLTFPILTQAAAVVFAVRAGDFPVWLAVVSGVLLVEQLAESATIFGHHGFLAPGGPMNSLLGPGLYAIWLIALGVAASRTHPRVVASVRA
jgi:hypothetical protein